jgi:hypothetical protein
MIHAAARQHEHTPLGATDTDPPRDGQRAQANEQLDARVCCVRKKEEQSGEREVERAEQSADQSREPSR